MKKLEYARLSSRIYGNDYGMAVQLANNVEVQTALNIIIDKINELVEKENERCGVPVDKGQD